MCNHHHTQDIVLPLKKFPPAPYSSIPPIQAGPPPRQSQIGCFLSYTFLPFLEFHKNRIIQNIVNSTMFFFGLSMCMCINIFFFFTAGYGSITICSSIRKLMNICIVSIFGYYKWRF